MAITKAKKEELVADLHERLARGKVAIMTDYKGLNVEAITKLRNELRKCRGRISGRQKFSCETGGQGHQDGRSGNIPAGSARVAISYEDPVAPPRRSSASQRKTTSWKSSAEFWKAR